VVGLYTGFLALLSEGTLFLNLHSGSGSSASVPEPAGHGSVVMFGQRLAEVENLAASARFTNAPVFRPAVMTAAIAMDQPQ
jgi:hypothetical protein